MKIAPKQSLWPFAVFRGRAPKNGVQFVVQDSKKYAATGGRGYAQFDKDGKPGPESDSKPFSPANRLSNLANSCSPVTCLDTDQPKQKGLRR